MDFQGENQIHYNGVVVVSQGKFGALEAKALQTLTADLQPAASGQMAAEKRPTWTDDC